MGDVPLPGMPEPPERLVKRPAKAGLRVTRIKGRRLCERCCEDIHVLGIERAPFPRVARWQVSDGVWCERLCEGHKTEVCDA